MPAIRDTVIESRREFMSKAEKRRYKAIKRLREQAADLDLYDVVRISKVGESKSLKVDVVTRAKDLNVAILHSQDMTEQYGADAKDSTVAVWYGVRKVNA